jgi:hypothetical protein
MLGFGKKRSHRKRQKWLRNYSQELLASKLVVEILLVVLGCLNVGAFTNPPSISLQRASFDPTKCLRER